MKQVINIQDSFKTFLDIWNRFLKMRLQSNIAVIQREQSKILRTITRCVLIYIQTKPYILNFVFDITFDNKL